MVATSLILLLLQDHHRHSFFNLFTFSFPVLLISLFLTWAASSTSIPPESPSSSALSAATLLSTRGYSLFASALLSPSFNATGTVLAPPDFALTIAAKNYLHAPPRASLSLLLHHTLKIPFSWQHLSSIADKSELPTLSGDYCLFLSKKSNGDISISGSKKGILSVKIRQPDLYVDDQLTVHGIDGVLDPNTASDCSLIDPTVKIKSHVDRMFLDHAIRALKRRGFTVVATAMAINRRDLMELTGVTIFAPSDATLFSVTDGFRYDFSHHVVPKRVRLTELSRVPSGTVMETMAPNRTIGIGEYDGRLTVNGVKINVTEVYHNRWIVVISVLQSLDDTACLSDSLNDLVPSPSSATSSTGESQVYSLSPSVLAGVPSRAPHYSPVQSPDSSRVGIPSHAPSHSRDSENVTGNLSPAGGKVVKTHSVGASNDSPAPEPAGQAQNLIGGPAPKNSLPFSSTDISASPPANILPPSSTEEFVSAPVNSLPFSSSNESDLAPVNTLPVTSTDESVSTPANSLPFTFTGKSPPAENRCSLDVSDGGDSTVFLAVEGEELFCPINARKQLERKNDDVALSRSSDSDYNQRENQSEPMFTLADDLFFYT